MCDITIEQVLGLAQETGPNITKFFVRGTVHDCAVNPATGRTTVTITVHTGSTPEPTADLDVAGTDWSGFVDNPDRSPGLCNHTLHVSAHCTGNPSCTSDEHKVWTLECKPEGLCPVLLTLDKDGEPCATAGHTAEVTLRVQFVNRVPGCTFIWLFGDEPTTDATGMPIPPPTRSERLHTVTPSASHSYPWGAVFRVGLRSMCRLRRPGPGLHGDRPTLSPSLPDDHT